MNVAEGTHLVSVTNKRWLNFGLCFLCGVKLLLFIDKKNFLLLFNFLLHWKIWFIFYSNYKLTLFPFYLYIISFILWLCCFPYFLFLTLLKGFLSSYISSPPLQVLHLHLRSKSTLSQRQKSYSKSPSDWGFWRNIYGPFNDLEKQIILFAEFNMSRW